MGWLDKVLKFADKAKDVIEEVQDVVEKIKPSDVSTTGSDPASASESADAAASGSSSQTAPNENTASRLLPVEDALRVMGEPLRGPSASMVTEEYECADYYGKSDPKCHLRIDLSTGMLWDYLIGEVKKPDSRTTDLGDESFYELGTLYVRSGETIFWISGDDALSDAKKEQAAKLVIARITAA